MNRSKWTMEKVPSLKHKVAIVTGANSGLGFYTTRALASKGAKVIMGCRNITKGENAKHLIESEYPGSSLILMELDLADLKSISDFADRIVTDYDRINFLFNNAGLMAVPYAKTADGFEMQFGVNHLGHFALTGHLVDIMRKTENSRIINVSSAAHKFGRIRFGDIHWEKVYRKWGAYGMSKLANLLFTYEFSRRINGNPNGLLVVSAHPGYANTELQTKGAEMKGDKFNSGFFRFANNLVAQSAEMGALSSLYAAFSSDVEQGGYYGPQGLLNLTGYPGPAYPMKRKMDPAVAKRLWEVSEELTGITIGTDFV